jgi:glycosyltransferase involved in cell wall biosynthesis
MNALLMRFSDAVVVTNEEDAAKVIASGTPWQGERARSRYSRPLYLIPIGSNIASRPPDGYDRAAWRRSLGLDHRDVVLSFFGFLSDEKGVETLLSALEMLVEKGLPVKLLMVGGSADNGPRWRREYASKIRAVADSRPYRDNILWTGFGSTKEVSAHLLAADIAVLPFREGASLRHGSLIAVLTHGLPVITTASPNRPSTPATALPRLMDGVNCKLVPPNNVDALVAAVEELAGSAELRARLREGALTIAEAFSWERIAQRNLEIYREVTGS